jgi:peroxiredoxin
MAEKSELLVREDVAPEFETSDSHGAPVRLSALRSEGPVVLVFLRSLR